MGSHCREEDLVFSLVREHTPQWSVTTEGGDEVALVTLRVIKEPPYAVVWPDGSEATFEDRQHVIDAVLERCNR